MRYRVSPLLVQRSDVHRTTTGANRLLCFAMGLIVIVVSPLAACAEIKPVATTSTDARAIAGTWWVNEFDRAYLPIDGKAIPFTPEGRKAYQDAVLKIKSGQLKDDAIAKCIPQGVPRILSAPYPILILQSKGLVTIVHEITHATRLIFLDQPQQGPDDVNESFMGHSVGKWDGDTLVIDTVGVKESAWIDGTGMPHSDQLHIIERLRKVSKPGKKNEQTTQLEDLITIEDPQMFTKPWMTRRVYNSRPDIQIAEYVCGEKNRDISSVPEVKRGAK